MALEIAGWIVLLLFIGFTAALCQLCENIVNSVRKGRDR